MSRWEAWLGAAAAEREAAGLRRVLTPRPYDDTCIDLAGNDYLGLARHPEVVKASSDAVRTWGAGAGAPGW